MKKNLILFAIFFFSIFPSVAHAANTTQNTSNNASIIFELLGSLFSFGSSASSPNQPSQTNPIPTNNPNNPDLSGRPNFVFYCQGNIAWKNTCALGRAGCGPTSLAMVLGSFGVNMNPVSVDQIFKVNGWRSCGDSPSYMTSAINSAWLRGLGFKVGPNIAYNSILDLNQAKKYLDEGHLIIASSRNFPCANCSSAQRIDHVFVVDGVDIASLTVSVRDSNNCSYAAGNDENPSNRIKNVSSFGWLYAYPIKK